MGFHASTTKDRVHAVQIESARALSVWPRASCSSLVPYSFEARLLVLGALSASTSERTSESACQRVRCLGVAMFRRVLAKNENDVKEKITAVTLPWPSLLIVRTGQDAIFDEQPRGIRSRTQKGGSLCIITQGHGRQGDRHSRRQ